MVHFPNESVVVLSVNSGFCYVIDHIVVMLHQLCDARLRNAGSSAVEMRWSHILMSYPQAIN